MVRRYDNNALAQVDLRIAELDALGETETRDFWRQIREEVERLLGRTPGDSG